MIRNGMLFTLLPAAFTLLPAAFTLLPAAFTLLPAAFTLLPAAFTLLPAAFTLLPAAFTLLPAAFTLLPAAFTLLPAAFTLLPAAFTLLPAAFTLLPAAFTLLPAAFTLLPAAFTLLPAAFTLLPAAFTLLPAAFTLLPAAFTLLPAACLPPAAWRADSAAAGETVRPHMCSLLTCFSPMLFSSLFSSKPTIPRTPFLPAGARDSAAAAPVHTLTSARTSDWSHSNLISDTSANGDSSDDKDYSDADEDERSVFGGKSRAAQSSVLPGHALFHLHERITEAGGDMP
ncbi:unnamed protein product [Closterium sp. Yama58-4]|nr:unnamed protein product [Closterium sp. Yama58-4]